MKVVFISSSIAIVWCMRAHPLVRRTYDKDVDTFRHHFLVAGCLLLALIFHDGFTVLEGEEVVGPDKSRSLGAEFWAEVWSMTETLEHAVCLVMENRGVSAVVGKSCSGTRTMRPKLMIDGIGACD
ncbi:ER lumen protein retaining receptor [Platanthera guangdongensis]|uniref:ER lumen protein retaining receptor n=1 Tax=Platanthera guangdongensis TaxID=2320717 RepID=A0ABR2M3T1_9ASPA